MFKAIPGKIPTMKDEDIRNIESELNIYSESIATYARLAMAERSNEMYKVLVGVLTILLLGAIVGGSIILSSALNNKQVVTQPMQVVQRVDLSMLKIHHVRDVGNKVCTYYTPRSYSVDRDEHYYTECVVIK